MKLKNFKKQKMTKKAKTMLGISIGLAVAAPITTVLSLQPWKNKAADKHRYIGKEHYEQYLKQAINTVYSESLIGMRNYGAAINNGAHLYNAVKEEEHKILDELKEETDAKQVDMIQKDYYARLMAAIEEKMSQTGISIFDPYEFNAAAYGSKEEDVNGALNDENINSKDTQEFESVYGEYGTLRKNYVISDAEIFSTQDSPIKSFVETKLSKAKTKEARQSSSETEFKYVANWAYKRITQGSLFATIPNTIKINAHSFYGDNAYQNNSLVPLTNLGDFFHYSYDLSLGVKQTIDDATSLIYGATYNDGQTDIVDTDMFNSPLETSTLQGNNDGTHMPYGVGEIFPNYDLVAKVKNVDFLSDSHNVTVDFELGICKANDYDFENPDYTYSKTIWFKDLNKYEGDDNEASEDEDNPKWQDPTIKLELTKTNIIDIARQYHYDLSQDYVLAKIGTNTPYEIDSANSTSSTLVIKDKLSEGQSTKYFSSYSDILMMISRLPNMGVGSTFDVCWGKRIPSGDENIADVENFNGGNPNLPWDFMPRFSDNLQNKININDNNDNSLFQHQKIKLQLVNYTPSGGALENGADFTFRYIIQDSIVNPDNTTSFFNVLDDGNVSSQKSLDIWAPIGPNGALERFNQIKCHLSVSNADKYMLGAMKQVLANYAFISSFFENHVYEGTSQVNINESFKFTQTTFKQYEVMYRLWTAKYVFDVLLPIITNALCVVYAILAATSFGVLLYKLAMALFTFAMSVKQAIEEGIELSLMSDAHLPAKAFYNESSQYSALNKIKEFTQFGDTHNWNDYYSEMIEFKTASHVRQLEIFNQFKQQTNNFQITGDIIRQGSEITERWVNKYKSVPIIKKNVSAFMREDDSLVKLSDSSIKEVWRAGFTKWEALNNLLNWSEIGITDSTLQNNLKWSTLNCWCDPEISYFAWFITKAPTVLFKFDSSIFSPSRWADWFQHDLKSDVKYAVGYYGDIGTNWTYGGGSLTSLMDEDDGNEVYGIYPDPESPSVWAEPADIMREQGRIYDMHWEEGDWHDGGPIGRTQAEFMQENLKLGCSAWRCAFLKNCPMWAKRESEINVQKAQTIMRCCTTLAELMLILSIVTIVSNILIEIIAVAYIATHDSPR